MASSAALKALLVSDEPATVETLRLARDFPTTADEMALSNWAWYWAPWPSDFTDVTETAAMRSFLTVTLTAISSWPPGDW